LPQLIFDITFLPQTPRQANTPIFLEQVKFGVWAVEPVGSFHATTWAGAQQRQYNLLVVIGLESDAVSHIASSKCYNQLALSGN
jgi:hypothetical protein